MKHSSINPADLGKMLFSKTPNHSIMFFSNNVYPSTQESCQITTLIECCPAALQTTFKYEWSVPQRNKPHFPTWTQAHSVVTVYINDIFFAESSN